jgi:hypothetical protein
VQSGQVLLVVAAQIMRQRLDGDGAVALERSGALPLRICQTFEQGDRLCACRAEVPEDLRDRRVRIGALARDLVTVDRYQTGRRKRR